MVVADIVVMRVGISTKVSLKVNSRISKIGRKGQLKASESESRRLGEGEREFNNVCNSSWIQ